jgi:Skp family chaperone for outer membrane proteins
MRTNELLSVFVSLSLVAVFLPAAADVMAQEGGKTAVKEESRKSAPKEGYTQEKEEFKRKTKERLHEFDRKMDELAANVREAGSKAKAETKKGMQDLKKKRAAFEKEMEKLEASTKKTWETTKHKVNDAMEDLEKTYDKVRSNFKSE